VQTVWFIRVFTALQSCRFRYRCSLASVIEDVHEHWWRIWYQASALAQSSNNIIRLFVVIGYAGMGVILLALDAMIKLLESEQNLKDVQIVKIWVFEPDTVAREFCLEVLKYIKHIHAEVVFCTLLEDMPGAIAQESRDGAHETHWLAICAHPQQGGHDVRALRGSVQTELHTQLHADIWVWHSVIQSLATKYGRAKGISIFATSRAWTDEDVRELRRHFGDCVETHGSSYGRLPRLTRWFISFGLGIETAGPTSGRHTIIPITHTFPDGSKFMPKIKEEVIIGRLKPSPVTTAYPMLVSQWASGKLSYNIESQYLDYMTIRSSSGEEMKAGVLLFLSHNGLIDGPIQQLCGKYPCLRLFDCRNGCTLQPAPIFAARCGQIMFCKNCSILMTLLGRVVGLSSYNGDYDAYYGAFSCSLDEGRQGAGIS